MFRLIGHKVMKLQPPIQGKVRVNEMNCQILFSIWVLHSSWRPGKLEAALLDIDHMRSEICAFSVLLE
jgi:hypothetical protein